MPKKSDALYAALSTSATEYFFKTLAREVHFDDPDVGPLTDRSSIIEHLKDRFLGEGLRNVRFQTPVETEDLTFVPFHSKDEQRRGVLQVTWNENSQIVALSAFASLQSPAKTWRAARPPMLKFPDGLEVSSVAQAKFVDKEWGWESWLVHQGSPFAYKLLSINAGSRTSLQYHRKKEEAAFLVSGQARLHFSEGADRPVQTIDLTPGNYWHVKPGSIHRVEALDNVILVEVSTPELDDVVRLHDDYGRIGKSDGQGTPAKKALNGLKRRR